LSPIGEVTLRGTTEDDLPAFFEFQRDPIASEMAAVPVRDHDTFMEHWRSNVLGNDAGRKRTVLLDGEVVGYMLSWPEPAGTLVGYWIRRDHWGKGVASRALAIFLTEVDERPLHAHVAAHNAGSIRVLERCGFTIVGEEAIEGAGVRITEVILRLDVHGASAAP